MRFLCSAPKNRSDSSAIFSAIVSAIVSAIFSPISAVKLAILYLRVFGTPSAQQGFLHVRSKRWPRLVDASARVSQNGSPQWSLPFLNMKRKIGRKWPQ